jgi:hypothetical protein
MAYVRANLQRETPVNNFGAAHYNYNDLTSTKAAVETAGYFNDASNILQVGDWIFFQASDGYGICAVTGNTFNDQATPYVNPGVVTVAVIL